MASIPSTMKAVQISKTGGVDVLEYKTDVPVPQPKEGEVLIKNEFIGVNYSREGAGTLLALGPGTQPPELQSALNKRVVYLSPGAYAEYAAVPALYVYPLPESIKNETAAAAMLQGLTAITLIDEAYRVQAGDWILVHAAAGGMGLWLTQLLKARGAHAIGTASTEAKRALAKQAGAEIVLPYPKDLGGTDAFVARIQEITGGKGVAAVFDGVGKDTFDASLGSIARKGSLISFGNASGSPEPLVLQRLAAKNARLMRPTLFNFIATREEVVTYTKELLEILEKGQLDVKVHEVYPLQDIVRAHNDLEGRKTTGKLLLKP